FEYVPETDGGATAPVWQPAPQGSGVATAPYHTDGQAPAISPAAPATASAAVSQPAVQPPPVSTSAPIPEPGPAPEPATQPVVRAERAPAGVGTWRWPAKGTVQKAFGNGNKGIDFKLDPAQPVLAAGGGEVVYAGNGLGGFRHLVIVKHDQRFLSAYSLNRPISVQEGERLASGGIIAGADPASAAGTLRFEIRRDGQPVDPASIIGR
ncbi:MAG: murein hydrolase activator EnvC family protein, partial [Gammaproteobacteria bacterium]